MRDRPVSLHHLSALDLDVSQLVQAGVTGGASHLCLFTQQPADAPALSVVIDDAGLGEVRRQLDDSGLGVLCITSFPILPGLDPIDYAAGLDRGATLGAACANVRIGDPDPASAADTFARFGELCEQRQILPCIEFTGYRKNTALAEARAIIASAGRGALTVDPLHVARSGTSWADIAQLPPATVGHLQLCDGPLVASEDTYGAEAGSDRLLPGDGEFPLRQLLAAFPPDMPVSLEVPRQRLIKAGMSPFDVTVDLVVQARAWLAAMA